MSLAKWSLDFCISWDKQVDSGLYCCEACRLADYQRGQPFADHAPKDRHPSMSSDSSPNDAPLGKLTFCLPPKIDFKTLKLIPNSEPSISKARTVQYTQEIYERELDGSLHHAPKHNKPNSEGSRLDMPADKKPGHLPGVGRNHISATTLDELRRYDDAFEHSRRQRERKQSRP